MLSLNSGSESTNEFKYLHQLRNLLHRLSSLLHLLRSLSLPLRSLLHQDISHRLSNLLQLLSLKMMLRAVTANGLVACQKNLENEIEEEDILNLDETYPADANIKIIRALKSDGERRSICIRIGVKNSNVEDFLYRLEKKSVIGDLDDFHVFFKGERVRITNHLHSFFNGSEHFITFVLRVKNLHVGGVRKSSKKQTEREKRFKALRDRMDETTKSVGQDRAGFDDTLFRKCEAEIAQLQSNLASASLRALVSKIGRNDIKAFREVMGDEDLLHQEYDG
eukprot:symbB.v1.2.038538.t1/scaffold6036.1/size29684/2